MSTCWLRRADGTLISQVLNPVVKSPCSWRRRGAGESVIDIAHDLLGVRDGFGEPCLADLLHDTPTDGRFVKTWWDTDIELAWWRGLVSFEPDTIPETAPTWAGPIVAGGLTTAGFVQIRAWTQEAYVLRSVVGSTLVNYLITGGASDYDFDDDPDLDFWTATDDVDEDPTATFETTTSGPTYIGSTVALVTGDPPPAPQSQRVGMYAAAILPDSPRGNYATASVAVYVPTGSGVIDDPVVASISLFEASDFVEEWDLELPDGWEHDTWYVVSAQVRQPPGSGVSYTFLLMGGGFGPIRFGRPRFTRPANVGSPAGEDISAVPSAITDEQVDLVPALTADDVTALDPNILLSESFRYFSIDHEDASSVLADWDGYGEWWVTEGVLCWAPERGEEIEAITLSSDDDLSGWGIEVDASGASTLLYGQLRPEESDGPPDEVTVGAASPNRLVAVEQIPAGMGPADSADWCTAALAQKTPTVSLTGVPVEYAGLPGDSLASYMPGNWMDVVIEPLSLTIQPTVDAVTWDPRDDKVNPTWVLGGKARQDPLAILTAQLRAAERARRVRRPRPTNPGPRQWVLEATDTDTFVEVSQGLPGGLFTVDVEAQVELDNIATAGAVHAQIFKDSLPARSNGNTLTGNGDGTSSTSLTVKGPCGVTGRSLVGIAGAGVTENTVRMTISRVAWSEQ